MRTAIIALCAAAAVLLGALNPILLAIVLAMLPLAVSILTAIKAKWAAAGLPLCLVICASATLPTWCVPPVLTLCALCGLTALSGTSTGSSMGWSALRAALFTVLSGAIVLRMHFGYLDVSDILAGRLVDSIEKQPYCNEFLIMMQQMGYLPSGGSVGAGLQFGRLAILLPAQKQELLLTLRGMMVPAFRGMLCAVCGLWPVVTGMLTTSVTDWIGAKINAARSMPPFGRWQLNPRARSLLCIAVLVVCLPNYSTASGLGLFMLIARFALIGACCVLGTSVLCGLLGRRNKGLFVLSCLLGTAASLFMTTAMPLFVMLDAAFDFRRIRPRMQAGE